MHYEYDSAVEYLRECYPMKFDEVRCECAENFEGTDEDLDQEALEELAITAAENTSRFVELLEDGGLLAEV